LVIFGYLSTYYQPGHPCAREQGSRNQRDVGGTAVHWHVAASDNKERRACLRQRNRLRRDCATVSPDYDERESDGADTNTIRRGCAGASDAQRCLASVGSRGRLRHRKSSNRCPR